jgi:FkbM family methyltransferase
MQQELLTNIMHNEPEHSLQVTELIARALEKLKLRLRAEKYQYKEDKAGIAYIRRTVIKGNIVFDIGAHKAGYLYFFLAQLGDTGKIFAFEPQSSLNRYLNRLKKIFKWENVVIESSAVSKQSGTAVLCIPYNNGKSSSPCATIIESHTQFQFQAKEEVNTISIDEYCRWHNLQPDFLKIDVEGNELSVLMGASAILQTCKPKILFECEARFVGEARVLETFRFLQGLGYRGYYIMDENIFPIEAFSIQLHQDLSSGNYCNNFIFE